MLSAVLKSLLIWSPWSTRNSMRCLFVNAPLKILFYFQCMFLYTNVLEISSKAFSKFLEGPMIQQSSDHFWNTVNLYLLKGLS